MPQAVAAFFVNAALAAGASATVVKIASFVGYTLGAIGTSIGLQKVSELLLGKPKIPRRSQDQEYYGTVEGRRIIYGQMRVSGLNVIPPLTSGEKNKFLHQVLSIAGHEVHDITTVYFNQDAVGTISSVTGSDNDGKITTGTYANKAWVRRYKGQDSQTSDYKLTTAFSQWTADHRGRGVAYLALTYEFDTTVFATGRPQVTCLVQGKKVYDPRKDSTQTAIGGSGSHRLATPSTFEYSNNPALCLADYLISTRVGLGEDYNKVDWATVADAADICDENVSVPNGSGGTTTQKRYTCNTVLVATDRFEDNIQAIAQAMMGACYYSGGKWRIYAGAWSASAFTLTADDLIDDGVDVITALPFNEKFNAVRGRFIDASNNYQLLEFPPVISENYAIEDGGTFYREVEFPSTTNVYEAQRMARLILRQSRNNQRATLRCGMSAWKIKPFETGTVTLAALGWTNKTVRCESWKFDPRGFVEIVVREDNSASWGDPSVDGDEYTEGQFPAANYFIPLNTITLSSPETEGYADSYYNNPALDAVRFNLVLGGDNNSWNVTDLSNNNPSEYFLGLSFANGTESLELLAGGIVDTSQSANNLNFECAFKINNPSLLSVYVDPDQSNYGYGLSPISGVGPGAQTISLPGVATIGDESYVSAVLTYQQPVYIEAYFDANPAKTTSKYFSGYTHFARNAGGVSFLSFDVGGSASNLSVPSNDNDASPFPGYLARMVFGVVDKDANPATLTAADIRFGALYTGNYNGGTLQFVRNGVAFLTDTRTDYGVVGNAEMTIDQATFSNVRGSSADDYTQSFSFVSFSGFVDTGQGSGTVSSGIVKRTVDTFDCKQVAFVDYVSAESPLPLGTMFCRLLPMFTHPGWDYDYTDPDNVLNPTPGTQTPDEPTALQALGDQNGINFSWTPPADFAVGSVYQLWEYTNNSPFSSATKIWEGTATSVFIYRFDTTTRYYWVRVIDAAGNPSATEPATNGIPAASSSVVSSLYAFANTSSVSAIADTATVTTGTISITAVGGTATYTYAWTKLSGDTITATSATSSSTTFSGATMVSGETRNAIFRCTVTDSASPQATYTVDVAVTVRRPAMSATASPGALYKLGLLANATTPSTTVTASGGSGSYTYQWTRLSGGFFTINSPTSATTTFTATNLAAGQFITGTYQCTVKDTSSPQKTAVAVVYITFEREGTTSGLIP